MNTKGMNHIIDKCYEYGIPVFKVNMITNGYSISNEFIETIKRFYKLISLCNSVEHPNADHSKNIEIAVSVDKYHTGYDPVAAAQELKDRLKGFATIYITKQGDAPHAMGRACHLKEALNLKVKKYDRRIEYVNRYTKSHCPYSDPDNYILLHDDQTIICCDMGLTAKGDLVRFPVLQEEYENEDNTANHICNVNDTLCIFDEILKYNTGKISCTVAEQREAEDILSLPNLLSAMLEIVRVSAYNPDEPELLTEYLGNGLAERI